MPLVDAKVEKVRDSGGEAQVPGIAHAVRESSRREVIGLDVGEAETEAFWREFLRGLVKRGLTGVQLAIRDAHAGLKAAMAQVLGCPWQRCTVHFLRDASAMPARRARPPGGADPPDLQPDSRRGPRPARRGRRPARRPLPKVAAMLERAEEDILAFYAFPADHWK